MINPSGLGQAVAALAASVTPLGLGAALVTVDTVPEGAPGAAVARVMAAVGDLPRGSHWGDRI